MAFDYRTTAPYPARSNHYLELYVRRDTTDVANNRSTYAWSLSAHRNGGWGGSFNAGALPYAVSVAGQGFTGSAPLNFSSGVADLTLASGVTGWVSHDAAGYLNIAVAASHGGGQFGVADTGYSWFATDRIPKKPGAPDWINATEVGINSMRINWGGGADNGGAAIDQYLLRRSLTPDFASFVQYINPGNDFTELVTGLTPGVKYYWKVYAHNSVDYGPASSVLAQATLPADPPGLVVAAALTGQQAKLTMTPPGGVSGVSKYNIERRVFGTTTPVTAKETTGTVYTDSGLQPGTSYEWRANAVISGYTSPWSGWVAATMPNPNTSPGDYFDGDTASTAVLDYSWVGTADLSRSVATGAVPAGWMAYDDDNPTGSIGVVSRANGGLFGVHAAQVSVQSAPSATGLVMGVSFEGAAAVTPDATYWGSLYLLCGAAQYPAVFQPGIRFFSVLGNVLSTSWGDVVQNATLAENWTWKRYAAYGVAPANAAKAAPVIRDAGSVPMPFTLAAGNRFLLDGAMVSLGELFPYFDGSTTDVPGYDYQWLDTPNASPSIRYTVAVPLIDPLADPDCTPLPLPPMPPAIPSDCIEDVGTWRRYVVQVPRSEVRQWTATLPTLVLETGSVAERQVRIRFFPNPDGLPPQQVDPETWEGELILSYVPPSTVITLDGVSERVRAEVAGAAAIPANQLLYGSNGGPATWPEFNCGSDYLITLDVPTDAPSGNLSTQLLLTPRV